MKGDFTRDTYTPSKHYSSVRMQQGRVMLDADWNEEVDILRHRIETEAIDVIGGCGVPKHSPGFALSVDPSTVSAEDQARLTELGVWPLQAGDFLISAGRAYVDGILCENEQLITFLSQPDLPDAEPIQSGGTYVAYLDVWQRHLTALEDPSIREVALGGPDTASRTKTIWQVKLLDAGEGDISCADPVTWPAASTGRLSARTEPSPPEDNPCVVPPGAGYRRLENQLYRIEIHKGSSDTGGPTFKWSRDNGSVLVAVEEFNANGDPKQVKVKSLGRDNVLGLHKFDWVEILDDDAELSGLPGTLTQILDIDTEHKILTLDTNISGYSLDRHARVRRWDSQGELTVEVPVTNDGYIKIEDGVEIKFDLQHFNAGDYWLIPARTVPGQYGDIEWPRDDADNPIALLPLGIRHHYCKLGVLTVTGTGEDVTITEIEDCRQVFPPLTELPVGGECCCTVSVGDGVHSVGNFTDIQTAVNSLPDEGGQVCIQTGIYTLDQPVVLRSRERIRIVGCRNRSVIVGPKSGPVFLIEGGTTIELSQLLVKGSSGPAAIVARKVRDLRIVQCQITNKAGKGRTGTGAQAGALPAIAVLGGIQVEISDNAIGGNPAAIVLVRGLRMSDNVIRGGGVWVRSGSGDVSIERNDISTGLGAGIRLGDAGEDEENEAREFVAKDSPPTFSAANEGEGGFARMTATGSYAKFTNGIAGVLIGNNTISRMGGSGITTIVNRIDNEELVENGDVEDLIIAENIITQCVLLQPDVMLSERVAVAGGIVLAMVTRTTIHRNVVRDNGTRAGLVPGSKDVKEFPACGIFVLDCAAVEITDNTVENNGTSQPGVATKQPAFQAGIALLLVFGNNLDLSDLTQNKFDLKAGLPAARVHDNVVSCPAGHALVGVALGSVSVQGNTLTTHNLRKQPDVFGLQGEILNLGACVFIFNLGKSALLSKGPAGFGVNTTLREGISAPTAYPDGRIMFTDNQVTFTSQREEAGNITSAIALWSQDDVSVQNNQVLSQLAAGRLFSDCVALGLTLRASGNFFNELPATAFLSYFSWALLNAMTTNESVHCMLALGTRVTEGNNLIAFPSSLCEQVKSVISPKG